MKWQPPILICLIALLAVTACSPASRRTIASPSLPGQEVATLEGVHVPYVGANHEPYNSVPPTSGPHAPQTVAPGPYREEIPEEVQVHALEHGHVLIQYAPELAADQVRVLEDFTRQFPRDVLVAPYSKLEAGVALTAWGRIERIDVVDVDRIAQFIRAHARRYDHGWQ